MKLQYGAVWQIKIVVVGRLPWEGTTLVGVNIARIEKLRKKKHHGYERAIKLKLKRSYGGR